MKRVVSIVTTVYNAEKFIAIAMNSVFNQIIEEDDLFIEYVIVNDCSPDNSNNVIHNFVKYWKDNHGGNLPKNFDIKIGLYIYIFLLFIIINCFRQLNEKKQKKFQ